MSWKGMVLAAILAALAFVGWEYRNLGAERDVAKAEAAQARSNEAASQRARAVEHKAAASDAAASAQYQKELENGKKDLDGAVARLRTALRLRDQQLAAARGGDLPATAGAAGGRDGEAGAEFSGAQRAKLVEALERFGIDQYAIGNDADNTARRLSASQALIQSDRQQ
ncbi:hypothetical protein ABH313_21835 [Chromobacterium vaccinii]|uniref:hypothetical protein n=1 Tax=Chromobacterium vaccinii TaxID=1108595 RepID=UPI0032618E43